MRRFQKILVAMLSAVVLTASSVLPSLAQSEPEVRVIVPDVPDGVIVSNCYRAVGRIYDKYSFSFCLKQRATYSVSGGGVRCEGRMAWDVRGTRVEAKLRRTSCNRGVAWSADSMVCRPSIAWNIILQLLGSNRPLLDTLQCTYTPARGTGEKQISFLARRI